MDPANRAIRRPLRFAVAFLICTAAAIARADEALYSEAWRWATFTTESGLPSDEILDLIETPKGTTWVATRGGIAWFDGYQWNKAGEARGLPNGLTNSISPFGEDQVLVVLHSRLYVGGPTGFTHLDLRRDGEVLLVDVAVALDASRILVQASPAHDVGWSLYVSDGRSVTAFETPAKISAMPRTRLRWTRDGSVWLTTDGGLMRWNGRSWEAKQYAAIDWYRISDLESNRKGEGLLQTIYPRDVSGLWTWRGNGPLLKDDEASQVSISTADVDEQGDILAICRSGCVKVRRGGRWISVQPVPTRMEGVSLVRFGSRGELWIGTPDGLHLYRSLSSRWEYWQDGDSNQRIVNALVAARDGTVWIGMGQGIDHRKSDGTLIEAFEGLPGVPFAPITGMTEDGDGGIWACSGSAFDGAVRWDGRTWKHFGKAEGLDAEFIHRICKDRTGRLWFMGMGPKSPRSRAEGPGAFRLIDGRFEKWGIERGLRSGRTYSMAEASDGALWFGTLAGLSRFRQGRWTHWAVEDGLRHSKVIAVAVTPDDRLWFGHQGQGLGYIDEQDRIQYVDSPATLVNAYIMDLQVDGQGCLWVGSSAGLFSMQNGIWSEFSRRCGLINSFLWPVVPLEDRVLVGTDGSGTGILHMTAMDRVPPRVALNLTAEEGSTAWFEWSTFAYQAAMPSTLIETRSRLDDQPWSAWSTQRSLTLRSLGSGSHHFQVQGKGLFGDINGDGVAASFEITPPLYKRPNFVIPVGLLTVAVLWLTYALLRRQRRHAVAITASERLLQSILDNTPAVIYVKGPDGRFLSINKRFEGLFHITRASILGKSDHELFPKEAADAFRGNDLRVLREGRSLLVEETAPQDDGPHTYISAKFPLYNADGTPYGVCGISTDITQRIRSAELLRQSEARFRATFDQAAVGISETDLSGRYLQANQRFCDIVGYGREELLQRSFQDITFPDDLPTDLEQFQKLLAGQLERYSVEKRYLRKDGSSVWVNLAVSVVRESSGVPQYSIAVIEDVTERKNAEEKLAERVQHALLAAQVGIAFTKGGAIGDILRRCCAAIVQHLDAALARVWTFDETDQVLHLQASAGLYTHIDGKHSRIRLGEFKIGRIAEQRRAHLTNTVLGDDQVHDQEWARREGLVSFAGHPLIVQDRLVGVIALFARHALSEATVQALEAIADAIAVGIDHDRAAEALRHEQVFLRALLASISDGIVACDAGGNLTLFNSALRRIHGFQSDAVPVESIVGSQLFALDGKTGLSWEQLPLSRALDGEEVHQYELLVRPEAGPDAIVSASGRPIIAEDGRKLGAVVAVRDITARKRAEKEKAHLEDRLRQSQKLEAVGTLASGVAHDFNNLLHAIFSYTDLAKTTLPANHPGVVSIEMVEQAARQARGVINSLLTFSHKGFVEKAPTNLTELIRNAIRLLRGALGSIDIVEAIDDDVWAKADSTQMHQVIMNLAFNARDAMPGAGRLRVGLTRRGPSPGEDPDGLVELAVQDDGEGMTEDVRARLFEPFFTTKPRGEGTGLGMSVIHAIVTDHGGRIDVDSQSGQGTMVTITLPGCRPPTRAPADSLFDRTRGRGELVLVVIDNEHVRSIINSTLRARGYRILAAADAQDAVQRVNSPHEPPRLIVLDLDISRRDGLAQLHQTQVVEQNIPVILITGAAEVEPCWSRAANGNLLRKPFQMNELVDLASRCLSRSRPEDA